MPPSPEPSRPAPPPIKDDTAILLAAAKLLGFALSARALLAAALLGAFILAIFCMFGTGWRSLIVLAVYCFSTVGPVTYLEVRKRNDR